MVAQVQTVSLQGIEASTVTVQVQVTPGLASFNVVGLPDSAVKESRERVRGAFHALGIALPAKRITVNLSPADTPKEGSHFDLPIAIGLLSALGGLPKDATDNILFMGELGLDGTLKPISGALSASIHALSEGASQAFFPKANAPEGAWAQELSVYGADNLSDIIQHLEGHSPLRAEKASALQKKSSESHFDFRDIKGQETVKRAAIIAAAGGHNMLMCGPPGSGKSMIAHRMNTILPPLEASEALEVSMIHSVAGQIGTQGLVTNRPFRDPHHSASAVALCGGGLKAKPGEMSLAHRGVLFLDEFPEFPRNVLETLRQPMESGNVTVSRANRHTTYPAQFQLIAAMNPCPCGYLNHPKTACTCTPRQVQNYRNKISGPLMDRIDIHVDVQGVDLKDLSLPVSQEGSAELSAKVLKARILQNERFNGTNTRTNAQMSTTQIDRFAKLDPACQYLLEQASRRFDMSARSYHRILRVARTIADLSNSENIEKPHLVESLAYRYIPLN